MEYYIWILVSVISLFAAFYWYATNIKFRYWSSRGIGGPQPKFPFGNMMTPMSVSIDRFEMDWLSKYGKIYGTYLGLSPVLTICDHELVKQVLVRDFHIFTNRRTGNTYHEVLSQNLLALEDDKWKRVRSIVSPTFTTGKLRSMHPLMNRCVEKFSNYLKKITNSEDPSDGVIIVKDVISGFTIDVVASTSFATETNANDDRTDSKTNPLLIHSKKIFKFNVLKIGAAFTFPLWLNNLLGVRYGNPSESVEYFINLIKQILASRASEKQKRNDLVQLLREASVDEDEISGNDYSKLTASADNDTRQESSKMEQQHSSSNQRKLTENEIIAQCILFFLAGFETTSSTITQLIYELAVNQDIQQRLLDDILEQVDGLSHDSDEFYDKIINKVPLLDAVIKETLRKYPPVIRLERRVGVDGYKLAGVELNKDQLVEISNYAIHHSEEYYPEPERFNPDRFMPENKHLLVPYTYLPFGQGPRNCLGMRFAYQEIKLFIAGILPRYSFDPTPKTDIPLKFKAGSLIPDPGQIPIKVSRR